MFFFRVPADEEIVEVHRMKIRRKRWVTAFYVSCILISIIVLLWGGIIIKHALGLLGELGLDEKDKNLISIGFGFGVAIASTVLYMVSCIVPTVQAFQGNPESKLLLKYHDRLVELGDIEDVAEQDGLFPCGLK